MRAYMPLRGVRILSFETAVSLPAGTRIFADLGADVVRVGRPAAGGGRLIAQFDAGGVNKCALVINLQQEEGRALARRLAAVADIVCNNFTPKVLKRFGLDYEALRAIRPDVIALQLSGYGTPGPWQDMPALGHCVEAAGGMNALIGAADDPPLPSGSDVYTDQVSGRYATLALVAALDHRRRTGEGQYIDLSMYETVVHFLGDLVMQSAREGRPPPRTGNRDAHFAPQGVYPCLGEDAWLALSVTDDGEWRALRGLINDDRLNDPALDDVAERHRRHDAIDAVIAAWTHGYAKDEAATLLQAHGIPAGPVQQTSDVPYDAQVVARGIFQPLPHPVPVLGYGAHPHLSNAWAVGGRARPALAEVRDDRRASRLVLRRWLGLDVAEVRRLEAAGALQATSTAAPGAGVDPGAEGGPADPDFARRLGLREASAAPLPEVRTVDGAGIAAAAGGGRR